MLGRNINNGISYFLNLKRNIKLFFFFNILFQLGMGFFMVMYNLYIRALGFPEQVNGQIVSLTALAGAIILIPAGILSDRIGRKKMLLIGTSLGSLAFLVRAVVEDYSFLIIFAFLSGLFFSFVQVSMIPFLAEHTDKSDRVLLFSVNSSLIMFSSMIGNMLGGFFTDIFQWNLSFSEVSSLKITLLIGGIFQLLAFIPLWKIKENRKEQISKKTTPKISFKENIDQWKLIFQFTFATLMIGFGSGLVIPYLNLYFRDRFMVSNSSIGFVVSLGQLATAIAMIIGPWLVKRLGDVRSVVILQLSSIPFLILTGYTNIFTIAAFGFLFRQALMNAGMPIQQSLMMAKINDNMKGLANSLSAMVFSLGWAVMGPVSTGIVARGGSYWGYATVFTITAILYIMGSLYFYWVFGRKHLKESKSALGN